MSLLTYKSEKRKDRIEINHYRERELHVVVVGMIEPANHASAVRIQLIVVVSMFQPI